MESVDMGTGHAPQPLVYRNLDAAPSPAIAFSPPSSAEEGELAENLSPLAKNHHSLPSESGFPRNVPSPQPEVTAFVHATLATRYSIWSFRLFS